MAAIRLWVRADLRRRWLSWVVLGVLAGLVVGLAAAAAAGARRTEHAVPAYEAAAPALTAGVLANSVDFDAEQRAAVAGLPEVTAAADFRLLDVGPRDYDGPTIVPADAKSSRVMEDVLVAGRHPDPDQADEAVVDENMRDQRDLQIGSTLRVEGETEEGEPIVRRLRVVGISKATTDDLFWQSTPAFART